MQPGRSVPAVSDTWDVDDHEPPICPVCGVTLVPASLSARESHDDEWVCVECEENGEGDVV